MPCKVIAQVRNSKCMRGPMRGWFTVLTSRLIRMEWAPADHNTGEVEFNDDATFVFINRCMEDDEVPKYTVTDTGENGVSIKTEYVTARVHNRERGAPLSLL